MLFSSSRGRTGADRFSWSHFLVLLMGNLIKNLPVAAGSLSKPLLSHHAKTSAIGSHPQTRPRRLVWHLCPDVLWWNVSCLPCLCSPLATIHSEVANHQATGVRVQRTNRKASLLMVSSTAWRARIQLVEASYGLRILRRCPHQLHKMCTQIRHNSKKAN